MKNDPISITHYALLFICVFLLVVGMLGAVTYQELAKLERDFHVTSQKKADDEIESAVRNAIHDIEERTQRYAAWEEVRQQLHSQSFYA